MGKIRLIPALLIVLTWACQRADGDTLPASDQLYRTWRLTQKSYDGQVVQPADTFQTVVTFPRDGQFRRDQAKSARWCCSPVSFEGTDTVIRFIWDTSDPVCALVDCRLSELRGDVNWEIATLTATSLVLKNDKTVLEFKPEP